MLVAHERIRVKLASENNYGTRIVLVKHVIFFSSFDLSSEQSFPRNSTQSIKFPYVRQGFPIERIMNNGGKLMNKNQWKKTLLTDILD